MPSSSKKRSHEGNPRRESGGRREKKPATPDSDETSSSSSDIKNTLDVITGGQNLQKVDKQALQDRVGSARDQFHGRGGSKIQEPSLFSKDPNREDHSDLVHAMQDLVREASNPKDLKDALSTARQQQAELLKEYKQYEETVGGEQQRVFELVDKLGYNLQNEMNNTNTVLRDLKHKYSQSIKKMLDEIERARSNERTLEEQLTSANRLTSLQKQLILDQQMYESGPAPLKARLQRSAQFLEAFTGIRVVPGRTKEDLIALVKRQEGLTDGPALLYMGDLEDKGQYQATAQVNNGEVTLKTVQMPQNVPKERRVQELFEGQSCLPINRLFYVYKEICTEFERFNFTQKKTTQ